MNRPDLYRTPHRAIRALLFGTTLQLARTDFAVESEARLAVAAGERLLGFLHEHAEHEERVLMPELERLSPEVAAELRADHHRTGGMEREFAQLLARTALAGEAERVSLGVRLNQRAALLTAEHLPHLEREEVLANRLLWAHKSDAELGLLHQRVVSGIPPARLAEWFELILPAMSCSERAPLVAGLLQAPPEFFELVTAPARRALGKAAWEATLERARTCVESAA
jgi:hypothetical protein